MTATEVSPAQAYADYYEPAIFGPLTRIVLDLAPPRAGERVLDLACGTGIVAEQVAAAVGADGHVVGVDLNPAMLEVARARPLDGGARVEWRHGDGVALDLPDGGFDRVYCQQGLQFFPDRGAGAREMHRVLVTGGSVVVAVWHGLERHPLFEALMDAEAPRLAELGVPATRGDLAAPFSLGDADELRELLTGAGFRDVEMVPRSIEARFATPDRFVERMEYAYAAVVPRFAEDPAAFQAFLDGIDRETRPVVDRYREGERIVVPMHANIALATA